MLSFGKNKRIIERMEVYLSTAKETLKVFDEAVRHLAEKGNDGHFALLAEKTQQLENDADDIRREIEHEMFEKSLLPETREDLLIILEKLDEVPTASENLVNMCVAQRTEIHPSIKEKLLELLSVSIECFDNTAEATRDCLGKRQRIQELNRKVDHLEDLSDKMELEMVKAVFAEESLHTGDKLLQKWLIMELGTFCDLCQDVLDRIVITSVKRPF